MQGDKFAVAVRKDKSLAKTTQQGVSAEVAIPLTSELGNKQQIALTNNHPLGKSIIAFDLGEVGIGYAVMRVADLPTKEDYAGQDEQQRLELINTIKPYKTGKIRINSSINLISRVKHYRNHQQPQQKFNTNYNNSLELMRNNVVGDLAHHIDSLCRKYHGVPIFESAVINLATGKNMLKLVYDKIIHLYCFSATEAHKAARKHHWLGADKWQHPRLLYQESKETTDKSGNRNWKPSGKYKDLDIYPGRNVHPAGTSQQCSCCGRNPIKLIEACGLTKFDIKKGGMVWLKKSDMNPAQLKQAEIGNAFGEREELCCLIKGENDLSKSKDEQKKIDKLLSKTKRNKLKIHPHAEQNGISKDKLIKLVKNQIRQKPSSKRSKDTSQSQYLCLFADCLYSKFKHDLKHKAETQIDADENAAINIARKWLYKKMGVQEKLGWWRGKLSC